MIKKKKQPAISRLIQLRSEYILENQRLSAGHDEDIRKYLEQTLKGTLGTTAVKSGILREDAQKIEDEVARIREAEERVLRLEKDEKNRLVQECGRSYWNENSISIITDAADNPEINIPEELRADVRKILKEMREETAALKQKADLQEDLFKQYDAVYRHYMEE